MHAKHRHLARTLALLPALVLLAACDPAPQPDAKTPTELTPVTPATTTPAPPPTAPDDSTSPDTATPVGTNDASLSPADADATGLTAAASHPDLGSPAWFEWVEATAGITDGHGHGPDHGSQEWCDAVSFKVYGERPDGTEGAIACDQVWMADIDARLRQKL